MYRMGHSGLAFVAVSPLVLCVGTIWGISWTVPIIVAAVMAARLPDADRRPPLSFIVTHRGATHTVLAAVGSAVLATGLVLAALVVIGGDVGSRDAFTPSHGRLLITVFVGTLAGYLSHLLGDAVTKAGITPYWPVSDRKVRLARLDSGSPLWNRVFFLSGLLTLFLTGGLVTTVQ
jgi:inner membrane protein